MTGNAPPISLSEKLLSVEQVVERYARPRNGKLVFTNGCFDILHRGHVEYLHLARGLGDALVVGLNTDRSVRELKGPERPINPQDDRATVLAALTAVDAVVLFDEDTPLNLIRRLLPDLLVKGGDYRPEEIVGAKEVVEAGGRVVVAPLVAGRSTTNILQRAQQGVENG